MLVRFKLGPVDIARMRIRNERGPLLTWQALGHEADVVVASLSRTPKEERAGVARVMQEAQGARVLERRPQHLARVRTLTRAPREEELLLAEGLDRRRRRSGSPKRLEEGADGALDLLI